MLIEHLTPRAQTSVVAAIHNGPPILRNSSGTRQLAARDCKRWPSQRSVRRSSCGKQRSRNESVQIHRCVPATNVSNLLKSGFLCLLEAPTHARRFDRCYSNNSTNKSRLIYHEITARFHSCLTLSLLMSASSKLPPTNIVSQLTKLVVLFAELALALKAQFSTLSTEFSAQLGTQTAVLGSSITGLIFGELFPFGPTPTSNFTSACKPSCLISVKYKVSLSQSAL